MDNYHFFSDPEYAGPGPMDLLKFWDSGAYTLRPIPRKKNPVYRFPDSNKQANAIIANSDDAKNIAEFWNNYYRGSDWNFICSWVDVLRWMKSGFILLLKQDSEIVGTFVCRLLPGIFCGKLNKQAALIDGLVVSPRLRGKGVASFLLAAMDYFIYNRPDLSQAIVLWFREHSNKLSAVSQAPVSVLEYSYAKISDIDKNRKLKAINAEPELVKQIVKTIYDRSLSNFTILLNDISDPDVYWYLVDKTLVGIAFTHRIAHGDYTIWEVVFAANLEEPYFDNLQTSIELASLKLPCSRGLIFASNSKSRGNSVMGDPWVTGKSGYLTTHVYNWMPPRFLNGDIFFPISCI
jgi:GNAT superfamily N-acetyltransferase